MEKDKSRHLFIGLLGITFLLLSTINYYYLDRQATMENNVLEKLNNNTLSMEIKDDICYLNGEGKLDSNDFKVLLSDNDLLSSDVVNVIIGDNISEIGYNCFNGYLYLETLHLGNGTVKLRNGSIRNCPNLQYIFVPKSLEKVGRDFLYGCDTTKIISDGNVGKILYEAGITNDRIQNNIASYDEFVRILNNESCQVFLSTDLYSTDPDSGSYPMLLHGGFVQYGPYTSMEPGTYKIIIEGTNLQIINEEDIYINTNGNFPVKAENLAISENKISYEITVAETLYQLELCISNSNSEKEIIEIEQLTIYKENDYPVFDTLKFWWNDL